MVELADAQDLGSCAARRVGSTPTTRIAKNRRWFVKNQRSFSFLGYTFGYTFIFHLSHPLKLFNTFLFFQLTCNIICAILLLEFAHKLSLESSDFLSVWWGALFLLTN